MIKRLPESAQTLYAELLQKSAFPVEGGGSYVTKKIPGILVSRPFAGRRKKQQYIGADTPALCQQIALRVRRMLLRYRCQKTGFHRVSQGHCWKKDACAHH
jgi:hypothetical protein